jgi:hypothetical protein
MKRLIAILAATLSVTTARAQGNSSNQTLNVQGILRTNAGDLQSMSVGLVVSLYPVPTGGTAFYSQPFTTVPVENGFFSVELAGQNLAFAAPDVWVGIQVAGDATEMPRQHLTAVPYAFSAASVSGVVPIANGGTGSNSQNFVDLTTNQSIGGVKTFTSGLNVNYSGVTKGVVVGDAGCNPNTQYPGISLHGPMSGCTDYNVLGNNATGELYLNRPAGADMHFRVNNGEQMTLAAGGDLSMNGGPGTGRFGIGVHQVVCTPNAPIYDCPCPAGEVLIAGGGYGNTAQPMRETRPSGNAWRVTCSNGTQDVPCLYAVAICLQHGF